MVSLFLNQNKHITFVPIFIFMKHLTALFIGLILSITSYSQKAKELLNEVDKKVKSYENIVIDFKYGLYNKSANMSQETNGNAYLAGEKYILNLIGTTQLFDGSQLYVVSDEDEEINISSPTNDDSFTPSKMLSFYQEGYNAKMDIIQNVNGREIQYVRLTPVKNDPEVKSILLGIDKLTKHIYKLVISQHNSTEVTITVNQFKTNQPLSNTLFSFDKSKYSGYYINNLD